MGDGNDKNDTTRGPSGKGAPPPPPPRARTPLGKGAPPPPPPRRGIGTNNFRDRQAAVLGGIKPGGGSRNAQSDSSQPGVQKQTAQQKGQQPFLIGRNINKMRKKEVLQSPTREKGEKLTKDYVSKRANYLMGRVAHALPSRNRSIQAQAIDRLIKKAEKGEISSEEMYGGLQYIGREIIDSNPKFHSRMLAAVSELCAEIEKQDPDLKRRAVADGAVEKFKAHVARSPSMTKGNPLFKKIAQEHKREKAGINREGVVKTPGPIDYFKGKAAAKMLKKHGKDNVMRRWEKGQVTSTKDLSVSRQYQAKRGIKSKFFQKKGRPAMAVELDNIMSKLEQDTKMNQKEKATVLVGALLDVKERIQQEKPNDKKYFDNSAMGKVVKELLKEIGLPDPVSVNDKWAEKHKEQYHQFTDRPAPSAPRHTS